MTRTALHCMDAAGASITQDTAPEHPRRTKFVAVTTTVLQLADNPTHACHFEQPERQTHSPSHKHTATVAATRTLHYVHSQ